MKILQLGKFYPVKGGVEKVMYDLMAGIAARGVHCDMLCTEADASRLAARHRQHIIEVAPEARVVTSHTWIKAASTTLAPSMITYMRGMARDYDIVHVHHPDPMAALALRLSGFKGKVVLHWHSDILRQRQLMRLYKPLQSWLIRRADVIVGTSPEYIAHSEALKDVQQKTVCIPIGIRPMTPDMEGAERIRAGFPGKKIIFFLGRLIPYKGLEYLVSAAAHLPEDYVIVIGGSGPLDKDLRQQAIAQGVMDRLVFLGDVPEEMKAAWFTACDLFVLPSVMKTEAFGIVQIEAMSLGRPVVATRIEGSGTAWVNAHGVSGLNVPVRDAAALARAMTDILGDPVAYAAYSRGAADRFSTLFHLDHMIDKTLSLYRSLK